MKYNDNAEETMKANDVAERIGPLLEERSLHKRLEDTLTKAGVKVTVIPLGKMEKDIGTGYGVIGTSHELDRIQTVMERGGFKFVRRQESITDNNYVDIYGVS